MKIKCIVIEDEPKALQLLAEYIDKIHFLVLVKTTDNPFEALNYLEENEADLIFLDINLPGLSGMDLSDLINNRAKIIFTTAYSEYAVVSYEKNAVDYLLKPITFNRFIQAVKKAKELIETGKGAVSKEENDSFFLKSGKKLIHLNWSDIYYIEGYKEYVCIVTRENRTLVYKRMKEIEELNSPGLLRVHNSYIVNINKIKKVEDNHIEILDKKIPVGKKYKEEFLKQLKEKMI